MISRTGSNYQSSGGSIQGPGKKIFYPLSCILFTVSRYLSPVKGFTLIEVIVAVSILAIGLVGVLRAYATSASAMEKVQYEMDAVFLLKTAMGRIEEKVLTQRTLSPGMSSGEFTSAEEANLALMSAGLWRWSQEVQKMDLLAKKAKRDPANKETRPNEKKNPDFYLNKLKLTVANSGRIPPREISLETYVGTASVQNS